MNIFHKLEIKNIFTFFFHLHKYWTTSDGGKNDEKFSISGLTILLDSNNISISFVGLIENGFLSHSKKKLNAFFCVLVR